MKLSKEEIKLIIGVLKASSIMATIGTPSQKSLEYYRKAQNLAEKIELASKENEK